MMQSMGHASGLQSPDSLAALHLTPPHEGLTSMARERDRLPPAQLLEQPDQTPKEVMTQSIGQWW
jgi:hypothetical protein